MLQTIDEEELEKLLTKQGHLFTNKELKDIMSQIDVDNNQSIDMMEYLAVSETPFRLILHANVFATYT